MSYLGEAKLRGSSVPPHALSFESAIATDAEAEETLGLLTAFVRARGGHVSSELPRSVRSEIESVSRSSGGDTDVEKGIRDALRESPASEATDEPIGFPAPPSAPLIDSTAPSSFAPSSPGPVVVKATALSGHWGQPSSEAAVDEPIGFPAPLSAPSLESTAPSSSAPVVEQVMAPPGRSGQSSSEAAPCDAPESGERSSVAKTAAAAALSPSELVELQRRVDLALRPAPVSGAGLPSARELQRLAADLAHAGETAAFIRIWDLSGGSAAAIESTWEAVRALHENRKRRRAGTLQLPALDGWALRPARRLHKIVKGRITIMNRSDAAFQDMDKPSLWLEEQRSDGPKVTGKRKMKLMNELETARDVRRETARGVVTKLKPKKLVDPVLVDKKENLLRGKKQKWSLDKGKPKDEPTRLCAPPPGPSLESIASPSATPAFGQTSATPEHWGQPSSKVARCNAHKSRKRSSAAKMAAVAAPSRSELLKLQRRVDCALKPTPGSGAKLSSAGEMDALAADLARAGETEAFIRIWDLSGGSAAASESTWDALEALHDRGKRRVPAGTLQLPALGRRTLRPARRLHKIAKGRITKNRSNAAFEHIDEAISWLEKQRAKGRRMTGQNRFKLVREFEKALNVPRETARGLVTKLKQKRLLDERGLRQPSN